MQWRKLHLQNRFSTPCATLRTATFASDSIYRSEVIAAMKLKNIMIALLGLGISGAPAFADPSHAQPAHPGTVNYVEGAAYLDGQPLNSKDAGNATLEA